MIETSRITALTSWLAAGAPPTKDMSGFIAECGRRLVAAGLPVGLFGVYNTTIHPQEPGRYYYWTEAGGPRIFTITAEQLRHGGIWVGNPAHTCFVTSRVVTYTIGASPEYDNRADMQRLAKRGYTQMLCSPLHRQITNLPSVASY